MKKLNFLVSLPFSGNGYQREQEKSARATAERFGIDLDIVYASGDAITQSQQLLKAIQLPQSSRPDAIIFEPMTGTGLPRVTEAASTAGISVAILACDPDFVRELHQSSPTPVLAITHDQEEIGRIQGRQFGALLPKGGSILYIQGPATSYAARKRSEGMSETKPSNIHVSVLRSLWTTESGYQVASAWLQSPISGSIHIDLVGCQNDYIAIGARKAFQEAGSPSGDSKWSGLLFTGVDGLTSEGQKWVSERQLAATVIAPPDAGRAIGILAEAITTKSQPPALTLIPPTGYPTLEELVDRKNAVARR
jgi:ribose transport system substrate-binding protein